MPLTAGACLHLSTNLQKHLWVILTDPDNSDPPLVALVNITTHKVGIDETLLLTEGHSYIKHKSAVHYERARIYEVWKLERIIESDLTVRHREDCSPELLNKIR